MTDDGGVDEDVLAYSNGSGPTRSLVLYHDRFGSTTGTIRESAPYARKTASGAKRLVRRTLADGLGLPDDPAAFVAFRDARTGLEYLRSCRELRERGLRVVARCVRRPRVLGVPRGPRRERRPVGAARRSGSAGRPVPSLEEALRELQLEPVHAPLRAIFSDGIVGAVLAGTATPTQLDELEARFAAFLAAVAEATGVTGDPAASRRACASARNAPFAAMPSPTTAERARALLAWLALSRTGRAGAERRRRRHEPGLVRRAAAGARARRRPALVIGDEGEAWAVADRVRVLLALARPSSVGGTAGPPTPA